jgi:hypothetical protein
VVLLSHSFRFGVLFPLSECNASAIGEFSAREARVNREGSVPYDLCREQAGVGKRNDLVIVAMHHESWHIDLFEVFVEIDF